MDGVLKRRWWGNRIGVLVLQNNGPVWILQQAAGLELELVYNSSFSTKLTLALKVFG
jgi:hypothetical protein